MSLIRRWTIYVCPLCGSDEYDSTENDSLCRNCGEWMNVEPVSVEPATTSGAVEALEAAVEAWEVEFGANDPPPDWIIEARSVLAAAGGQ